MLKVLICDDEPLICDLLQYIIDWEKLGFKIIGITNSGKKALEIMLSERPEVVVTDIRMPEIDGLKLVKASHINNLDISFIIISGHKNFDYAYESIRYGVENYLIKPINEEELTKSLLKIKKERETQFEIQKKLKHNKRLLIYNFFEDLYAGKTTHTHLEEFNLNLDVNFQQGFYQVILVRIEDVFANHRSEVGNLEAILSWELANFREVFLTICNDCLMHVRNSEIVIIANFLKISDITKNLFQKQLSLLKAKIDQESAFYFTMGLGAYVLEIYQLQESYQEARRAIDSRLVLGCGKCIQLYTNKKVAKVTDFLDKKNLQQFEKNIEQLNSENIKDFLEWCFSVLDENSKENPYLLYEGGMYLVDYFETYINKIDYLLPEYVPVKRKMFSVRDKKEFISGIILYITEYISEFREFRKEQGSIPVRRARKYIMNHLGEDISLDIVADYVNLNAIYFSALFKKETGENFLNYITEMRLEKAKEYLISTNEPIANVAKLVGYYDTKYFSKLFKKNNNITPQQFRKIYGRV